MKSQGLDIPNRRAAAISRRAPLLTLGTAGWMAAFTHPLTAAGKKNSSLKRLKKAKKQCQRDLLECETQVELCAAQAEQCIAVLDEFCGNTPSCRAQKECCTFLASCDVGAFLACI